MKNYELTYLIKGTISEAEAQEIQNKIISLLQEKGGILIGSNTLFKKQLAYPIKKENQAYLAVLSFELSPENLLNFEKELKAEKEILRYLILIKKKEKAVTRKRRDSLKFKLAKEGELERKPETIAEKKVELKEIEKKLEEILNEPQ